MKRIRKGGGGFVVRLKKKEGDVKKKDEREGIFVSRERGRATDEMPMCPMVERCVGRV